jgi:serine/threonine-protein kinase HipA
MRLAKVYMKGVLAGTLCEYERNRHYSFEYLSSYVGSPISLTLPVSREVYSFDEFPGVFDGLLPEGLQLDALLKTRKVDSDDYFSQLMIVGEDLVGAITVEEMT